jgi:hypothetical protein
MTDLFNSWDDETIFCFMVTPSNFFFIYRKRFIQISLN